MNAKLIFVFALIAAAFAAEEPSKRVQRDIVAGVYPGLLPAGVIPTQMAYPYGFGARYLEYPAGVSPKDCFDYPFCTKKLSEVNTVVTNPDMATRVLVNPYLW